MYTYAFELGQNKDLSLAELNSLLGEENLSETVEKIAIYELKEELNPQLFQDKLGGTIKIMKVVGVSPYPKENAEELTQYVEENLENLFSDISFEKTKIDFGISLFNLKNYRSINIKSLLKNFKKFLKNSLNLSSRFINNTFENPKSSTIYVANLPDKGLDINIIWCTKNIVIARGVSIQNIDAYKYRDYEKPARDARIGMLPPKLAQIMLNLAGPVNTIFDPFCGTGTILYEGMLMDKQMIGSDNNNRMVEASKINCEFIEQKFNTPPVKKVFFKDATQITESDIGTKIDAIVTEGYLGPAVNQIPLPENAYRNYREIRELYIAWINNSKKFLKDGAKIIFCLPVYSKEMPPPLDEILKATGLKLDKKFLYKRPDQIVGREICILEKIS